MGDVSENFSRKEFACKCGCGFDAVDTDLLAVLERLRKLFGPILITSGNRCQAHNLKVGGSTHSQHLYAKAVDIKVRKAYQEEVADVLEAMFPDAHGIGRYNEWTHFDVRKPKARWDMT